MQNIMTPKLNMPYFRCEQLICSHTKIKIAQVFRQANFEKGKESSDNIVVLELLNGEDISKAKATSSV